MRSLPTAGGLNRRSLQPALLVPQPDTAVGSFEEGQVVGGIGVAVVADLEIDPEAGSGRVAGSTIAPQLADEIEAEKGRRRKLRADGLFAVTLGIKVLEAGEGFGLLHAGTGQGGPAADEPWTRLDLVEVDAADDARLVAGDGPARRQRLSLADADAQERRARADHPLDKVDVVLLCNDADPRVGFAAGLGAFAGV